MSTSSPVVRPEHLRPFGRTGLSVPPVLFGTGALGNQPRVLSDFDKRAICGEWFRQVTPPVLIEIGCDQRHTHAWEFLAAWLDRMEIAPEEIILHLRVLSDNSQGSDGDKPTQSWLLRLWREVRERLGGRHSPQLVSVGVGENRSADAGPTSPRIPDTVLRAFESLKAEGVRGCGIAIEELARWDKWASELDFVVLAESLTVLNHSLARGVALKRLAALEIAVVAGDVFHGGFLTGGEQFEGRPLDPHDRRDQAVRGWRKSFVALCRGYGVSPLHACMQFALAHDGAAAVAIEGSDVEQIEEASRSAVLPVPAALWEEMKEERLIVFDVE